MSWYARYRSQYGGSPNDPSKDSSIVSPNFDASYSVIPGRDLRIRTPLPETQAPWWT